jgi:hypothetical protein
MLVFQYGSVQSSPVQSGMYVQVVLSSINPSYEL